MDIDYNYFSHDLPWALSLLGFKKCLVEQFNKKIYGRARQSVCRAKFARRQCSQCLSVVKSPDHAWLPASQVFLDSIFLMCPFKKNTIASGREETCIKNMCLQSQKKIQNQQQRTISSSTETFRLPTLSDDESYRNDLALDIDVRQSAFNMNLRFEIVQCTEMDN